MLPNLLTLHELQSEKSELVYASGLSANSTKLHNESRNRNHSYTAN